MEDVEQVRRAEIGDRLRKLRGEKLQVDLANELGITQAYYAQIETGKREITVVILLILYRRYKWNPSWILLGIEPSQYQTTYKPSDSDTVIFVKEPEVEVNKPLEKMNEAELLKKQLECKRMIAEIDRILIK